MFEDILPAPRPPVSTKRLTDRPRFKTNIKTMPAEKRKQVNVLGNCGGKILPKTLIEQIMDINDIRQLIQILEVAKTKVRRKKLNQRKDRKKWEN